MSPLEAIGTILLEIGSLGFGVTLGFAVKGWLERRKTSGVDNGSGPG